MRIPVKLLLTFMTCFGVMAGVSLLFLKHHLTEDYDRIERRDVSMHMGRVQESLAAELEHLRSFSLDWAVWTEMYRYVGKPDATWAKETMGSGALQTANLSLLMIYNAQGKLLLMHSRDEKGDALALPTLPASPYVALFNDRTHPSDCGMIRTDAGLMLVCWARVTRSDGSGGAAGTVVMGRLLDRVLTAKLREQIKLPITLQTQQALPPGLTPWPGPVAAAAATLSRSDFLTTSSDRVYQLYYPLLDLQQQAQGFIALEVARDVHLQGGQLFREVGLQLALIALVMSLVLGVSVHWLLIRRLQRLTGQLATLAEGAGWDTRIHITGRDELGLVAVKVNQLLALIETQVEKLKVLTLTDVLTGLPNRRAFDARLAEEYARARRTGHPLALLALDVDYFKRYNDHYGHPAGDAALQAVAAVLRLSLGRPADFIARIGGEEFAVLLPETGAAGAQVIGNQIVENFRQRALPHADSPVAPYMTASMGIAIAGDDAQDALWSRADRALYQAKHAGRNQAVCAPVT